MVMYGDVIKYPFSIVTVVSRKSILSSLILGLNLKPGISPFKKSVNAFIFSFVLVNSTSNITSLLKRNSSGSNGPSITLFRLGSFGTINPIQAGGPICALLCFSFICGPITTKLGMTVLWNKIS